MRMLTIFSALASLVLMLAGPVAAQPAGAPLPAVSVQQASVEDPGHAPIVVAIFTPPAWSSQDQAARAASGPPVPLIIISHGTGAGPISHVDTAQALAAAGFVVAAPMHPGDNFQDDSIVGRPQWMADRSRHVGRVIDFMLTAWEGRERLIPDRVGIFGFSAGATTALVSIGGEPDLGRVPGHCERRREFVCGLMAAPSPGGSGSPQWVHDRRIAAAVIAAPGLGFAFAPSGLANVRVPIQLWAGGADETVPYDTNAAVVRELVGPAVDFHRVEGAVHLSFLAPCTPQSPPQLCQDREGFDRAAFHAEFNRSVVDFFRAHLAGNAGAHVPASHR